MCKNRFPVLLKRMYEKYYAPIEEKEKSDSSPVKAPCKD
jgi:hypothetical protein